MHIKYQDLLLSYYSSLNRRMIAEEDYQENKDFFNIISNNKEYIDWIKKCIIKHAVHVGKIVDFFLNNDEEKINLLHNFLGHPISSFSVEDFLQTKGRLDKAILENDYNNFIDTIYMNSFTNETWKNGMFLNTYLSDEIKDIVASDKKWKMLEKKISETIKKREKGSVTTLINQIVDDHGFTVLIDNKALKEHNELVINILSKSFQDKNFKYYKDESGLYLAEKTRKHTNKIFKYFINQLNEIGWTKETCKIYYYEKLFEELIKDCKKTGNWDLLIEASKKLHQGFTSNQVGKLCYRNCLYEEHKKSPQWLSQLDEIKEQELEKNEPDISKVMDIYFFLKELRIKQKNVCNWVIEQMKECPIEILQTEQFFSYPKLKDFFCDSNELKERFNQASYEILDIKGVLLRERKKILLVNQQNMFVNGDLNIKFDIVSSNTVNVEYKSFGNLFFKSKIKRKDYLNLKTEIINKSIVSFTIENIQEDLNTLSEKEIREVLLDWGNAVFDSVEINPNSKIRELTLSKKMNEVQAQDENRKRVKNKI